MSKTLSRKELSLIGREGERIKNGLANLVEDFPNHAKTITGMSKWLTANKSTCQRMVETINKAVDGLEVIESLPGPAGLKGFIDLAQEKSINPKLIEDARSAVQRFENLIYEYSRSHSALKKLVKESSSTGSEATTTKKDARQALYEAAKLVTGESMESSFFACIIKESQQNAKYLQQFTLSYYEGCQTTENSRPIMVPIVPGEDSIEVNKPELVSNTDQLGDSLSSVSVIKELTSPSISNRINDFTKGDNWMVVPTENAGNEEQNIGVIKNYPQDQLGPFHGGKNASCVGAHTRYPTKSLYLVCFLDKKYAMRSVANAGIYSSGAQLSNIITSPDSLWFDRFHDEADLGLCGPHEDFSEKLGYQMANELVDDLFSMSKCSRDDYTCFLMKVDYPVWSTAYRIYFQYAID